MIYNDGKLKVIKEMIAFVEKEIEAVKSRKTDPNSEAQITAYGKVAAYNKVLQKLRTKMSKIHEKARTER